MLSLQENDYDATAVRKIIEDMESQMLDARVF